MGVTNLNAFSDGMRVLRTIFVEAFRPLSRGVLLEAAYGRAQMRRKLARTPAEESYRRPA
jgi:hypothetical protein